jgi:carbon-monoxide dehydrogenase medium subunit
MKPPPFGYHDPADIPEAIALLGSLENARLLAGGQSLMPMLNMRYAQPDHLIDLRRVPGLAGITEEGGTVVIGAMTRQRDVEYSPIVEQRLPLLCEAIRQVGHRQTRNRGTLGGSLCHLDPAAEQVSVCAAYDAEMVVVGPEGERRIAAADWPLGYMTPSLAPEEMLIAVRFTPWTVPHGSAFIEFARRHGDFAIASAGALVAVDKAGLITRVALSIGGVGPAPVRVSEVEASLIGQTGGEEVFKAAGATCGTLEAMGDALVPASYRSHLAGVMAKRALTLAYARAKELV